jgi:hypothetical protein
VLFSHSFFFRPWPFPVTCSFQCAHR